MNGPLYNALMLVGAGNRFLAGRSIGGFWPAAHTFTFINTFEFRLRPPSGRDEDDYPLLAADPVEWFEAIKPWCRGLRLHHTIRKHTANQQTDVSDRMLAGFVGGGARWLIEASGDTESELWEAFHRVSDPRARDRKIWACTHILQGRAPVKELDADAAALGLEDVVKAFSEALVEIEAFAREEAYTNFADIFRNALAVLDAGKVDVSESVQDMIRYTDFDQRRLSTYEAASLSSVFGGMGSWNDLGGGERYDALSDRLYNSLNDVTAALANSTYPG